MALLLSICILLEYYVAQHGTFSKSQKVMLWRKRTAKGFLEEGEKLHSLHSAMSGSFWWAELLIIMQICANFKLFSSFSIIGMKDRQALSNQI